MKAIVSAVVVLLGATTFSYSQSLPNYGPNAPATGDSYGKPYSGAKPLRAGAYRRAPTACASPRALPSLAPMV
ncbi:MAG TPA: hypothetical protein VI137_01660 [Pseudolabrys sp.]